MTPKQRIRREILIHWCESRPDDEPLDCEPVTVDTDAETVDALFDDLESRDELQDLLSEFREGEVETNIACDWSRHYESKSVAASLSDGTWVGWTYWYGGGKHGEPVFAKVTP